MTFDQPDFFTPPPPSKSDTLQARWQQVKQQQPELLDRCYALCKRAQARGFKRWSADAMFHVLRFETGISTDDKTGLKINNDYTAFIARDLMDQNPDLNGFFQLREQKPRGNWGHIK